MKRLLLILVLCAFSYCGYAQRGAPIVYRNEHIFTQSITPAGAFSSMYTYRWATVPRSRKPLNLATVSLRCGFMNMGDAGSYIVCGPSYEPRLYFLVNRFEFFFEESLGLTLAATVKSPDDKYGTVTQRIDFIYKYANPAVGVNINLDRDQSISVKVGREKGLFYPMTEKPYEIENRGLAISVGYSKNITRPRSREGYTYNSRFFRLTVRYD